MDPAGNLSEQMRGVQVVVDIGGRAASEIIDAAEEAAKAAAGETAEPDASQEGLEEPEPPPDLADSLLGEEQATPAALPKEKPQEGTVVAVGPGRVTDDGNRIPMDVAVGDTVVYSRYSPQEYKEGDTEYLILREDDILFKK